MTPVKLICFKTVMNFLSDDYSTPFMFYPCIQPQHGVGSSLLGPPLSSMCSVEGKDEHYTCMCIKTIPTFGWTEWRLRWANNGDPIPPSYSTDYMDR